VQTTTIGVVHPGAMGATVAGTLRNAGHDVVWASEGRGAATSARAADHGLRDIVSMGELCRASEVVISVCPPHAAKAVARAAAAAGFAGTYVDANAVSPATARAIADVVEAAGATFVDAGIIGGPAVHPGTTWLHLSGRTAGAIAEAFVAGPLEVAVVSDRIGDASALKMCFAAYSKGTTALLAAAFAAAHHHGVLGNLAEQWDRYEAGSFAKEAERVRRSTSKAWRFVGEMREIDATFQGAGVPAGFHDAASRVYALLAGVEDAGGADAEPPDLERVLQALRGA
jgi:3-hydroxyisobutyrate dehydrogenase-like beta-hydroxyacid dehydrogenase